VNVGSGWRDAGTTAVITATPDSRHDFLRWTGDVPPGDESSNPLTLTMDQARGVQATFLVNTGSLIVTIGPPAAVAEGAQWRLTTGPDVGWHTNGALVSGLPVGTYAVNFSEAFAFDVPDSTNIVIVKDSQTAIAVKYPIPEMVRIPGGTYLMGGTSGCPVTISSFYMDAREVTVADYQSYCTAAGSTMPAQPSWSTPLLPVVNVSHSNALAFAAWKNKRLPSEAEWEYATRGGLVNARFPWGDTASASNANFDLNRVPYNPTEAGTYVANDYGLFDVAGNAQEWVNDRYTNALPCSATDPIGPTTGSNRVVRGGSYASATNRIECANRSVNLAPSTQRTDLGFRCALTFVEITRMRPDASGQRYVIEWNSRAGQTYSVDCTSDPRIPYTALTNGLMATPTVNAYTSVWGGVNCRFFRVRSP
jgi:formylglycine-generating enzyme required for sulfatase activity